MKVLLLSAGLGTRLSPLTDYWPKCMMPVAGRPLLSRWLDEILELKPTEVIINTHHLSDTVTNFVKNAYNHQKLKVFHEKDLLGTAGTIRACFDVNLFETVMVVHADNYCEASLREFVSEHTHQRPSKALITMMTFHTEHPQSCGIVKTDSENMVVGFEKPKNLTATWPMVRFIYLSQR